MANQPKKYQKFVATAATATLVASAIVPAASAAEKNFTDIEKYAQETQDAIYSLVDRGVITGKSDSIFAPAESITRGQVVKMLGRYLVNSEVTEVPTDWASKQRFTDLPVEYKDQDLVKNAAVVFDNGVFKGSNGKLNVSNNITRENMALVLDRAILALNGKTLVQLAKEEGLKGNVKDIDSAKAEARDAILALNAFGISAVDNFNPKNDVNRAQFALFLERTIEAVLSDTTEELVEKAVVAGNALPKPEDVTKDNAADAQAKVDVAQKALDNAQKALNEDKELASDEKLALQQKLDKVAEQIKAVKDAIEATKETAGITSVKAINDTTVEVTFGKEIDKDFIREAELSGKYFVIYTEGESVQSARAIQSKTINFSSNGKTAEFTVGQDIESGKKYHVALLNGEDNRVAEVVHTYGPTELKEAAKTPEFNVSASADKIYVKYNTKMKDSAKEIKNYTVYDEGGQELGPLSQFINSENVDTDEEITEGKWVNLNDKKEVEFKLNANAEKKLLAGKTYKLLVNKSVKTDDNKTLSDSNRTVKVKTPSVDEASPVAKVARIMGEDTIHLVFDKDISKIGDNIHLNPAQLDLRTSTGKTVEVKSITEAKIISGNTIELKLDLTKELDRGTTYKVDMPANIVQNGVFPNATNKATTGLDAKAQENKSIESMGIKIVANAKQTGQADLIVTFDQVPVIDNKLANAIQLFDGRDEYKLPTDSEDLIKVYGEDTSGKSIIIENVAQFLKDGKALNVRGDKSYDVEIKEGNVTTDAYGDNITKATNKSKLKASTKGVSVSAPVVDEVTLVSAEKIEIAFKEEIAGTIDASDLEVMAFVPNRSDIYVEEEAKFVSGSGYYDVKSSGKVITITAKNGVKFPTSFAEEKGANVIIDADAFTNKAGNVGNEQIVLTKIKGIETIEATVAEKDLTDKAAPIIVQVKATDGNTAVVTYSEAVEREGAEKEIASLFKAVGEDTGTGFTYATIDEETSGNKPTHNSATITFKEHVWKESTDLSKVTLSYTKGNTYFLQDSEGNKMAAATITGLTTTNKDNLGDTPVSGNAVTKEKLEQTINALPNNATIKITDTDVETLDKDEVLHVNTDNNITIDNTSTKALNLKITGKGTVTLEGKYDTVTVDNKDANLVLESGSEVENLIINDAASKSVTIKSTATVTNVQINDKNGVRLVVEGTVEGTVTIAKGIDLETVKLEVDGEQKVTVKVVTEKEDLEFKVSKDEKLAEKAKEAQEIQDGKRLALPEAAKSITTDDILFQSIRIVEKKADGKLGSQVAVTADTLVKAFTVSNPTELNGKNHAGQDVTAAVVGTVVEANGLTIGLTVDNGDLLLGNTKMTKTLFEEIKEQDGADKNKPYSITVTNGAAKEENQSKPKTPIAKIEFTLDGEEVVAKLVEIKAKN